MTYEEAANAIKTRVSPMRKAHQGNELANEFIDCAEFMASSVVREAVEKQTPKKPHFVQYDGNPKIGNHHCPTCDRIIELKPCPFCGGEAKIHKSGFEYWTSMPHNFTVYCVACGASVRRFYENEQKSIEAWNRRITDAN